MKTYQLLVTVPAGELLTSLLTDTLGAFMSRGSVTYLDHNRRDPGTTAMPMPKALVPIVVEPEAHPADPAEIPTEVMEPAVPAQQPLITKHAQKAAISPDTSTKWLVLVDAENLPACYLESILLDLRDKGVVDCEVRIFGDFSDHHNPSIGTWNAFRSEHRRSMNDAVSFVHCGRVNQHKSTTDMHLALSGSTSLTTGGYQGLAIVSSDSDFLPLIAEWSHAGKKVQCYGQRKEGPTGHGEASERYADRVPFQDVATLVFDWVEDTARDLVRHDGLIYLADLSIALHEDRPTFKASMFGYETFRQMIASCPRFEVVQGNGKPPRARIVSRPR